MRWRSKSKARDIAFMGLLTALAVIMSYVEYRIPISLGVPGLKLGLCNIVIVFALYCYGFVPALLVSLARVGVMALLFGNPLSALYSLAGAALSLAGMALLKRSGAFSPCGVSAFGGTLHNIGQLCVAALVLGDAAPLRLAPVLMIAGIVTGFLIGLLVNAVLKGLGARD